LPKSIAERINKFIGRIAGKVAAKLTKICDEGGEPTICECENAEIGEISFPLTDGFELVSCKPTRCTCPGQDEWVTFHPGQIIFNQLLGRICAPEGENGKFQSKKNPFRRETRGSRNKTKNRGVVIRPKTENCNKTKNK
jgi:hypothetical protein